MKFQEDDWVTHVTCGGKGKVLRADDTHSQVQWEVNAPRHVGTYYNTELRYWESIDYANAIAEELGQLLSQTKDVQ